METLKRWWDFWDGKKTQVGGALLLTGHILGRFTQTLVLGEILTEIGIYMTSGGLVHKAVKAATTDPAKG